MAAVVSPTKMSLISAGGRYLLGVLSCTPLWRILFASSNTPLHIPVIAFDSADDYLLSSYANLSSHFNDEILVKDVKYVKEGDEIVLSTNPQFSLRVIHTPGHTTDSVVYYSENDRVLFSGDTIFKASIGNTRFPGGDYDTLVSSIIHKIFTLPEDTVIYSGHSEPTSVGTEKRRYF